jgi:hypothetical protein
MLEKLGMTVEHIDNPLIHDGMDPNAVYLQKVETALRTLHHLGEPMHSASPLVRLVRRIKRWHLTSLCRLAYRLTRPLLYRHIQPGIPTSLSTLRLSIAAYILYTRILCLIGFNNLCCIIRRLIIHAIRAPILECLLQQTIQHLM